MFEGFKDILHIGYGEYRDPDSADFVRGGVFQEDNSRVLYEWDDGYWEIWLDENSVADRKVIQDTKDGRALVAKGHKKGGWKKISVSEFMK